MKSKFLYPTKRNVLIGFVLGQLLPIIFLGINGKYGDLLGWFQFEIVVIGCLSLWQLKPLEELDEREKEVTLKWKSRTLDYGSSLILIPIIALSIKPEIEGWSLFNMTAVPVFLVFIFCSLMAKREFGYYFIDELK